MKSLILYQKNPTRAWIWRSTDFCGAMESHSAGLEIKPTVDQFGTTHYWLGGTQYLWDGAVIVEEAIGRFRVYPMEEVKKRYDVQ
jgi:hypothetical protein